jgi:sterol desaturase/sphingolipid hydroxylase (fatty acid hydroxylase superfamily)
MVKKSFVVSAVAIVMEFADLVYWGIVPYVAVNLGFYVTWFLWDVVLWNAFERATYGGKQRKEVQESYAGQLSKAAWEISGPSAVVNAAISTLIMSARAPGVASSLGELSWAALASGALWPDVQTFVLQFVLLFVLGDLGLYVGHRALHDNEWLWNNCHTFHHSVHTPTAASTLYIDPIDKTIQGGLPIIVAALLVCPHPCTFAVYGCLRVSENVLNHTGVDSLLVDVLSLKVLPGRASVRHHDSHHRFSNHPSNAKNFGESFWIWDYLFGTYRNVSKESMQ